MAPSITIAPFSSGANPAAAQQFPADFYVVRQLLGMRLRDVARRTTCCRSVSMTSNEGLCRAATVQRGLLPVTAMSQAVIEQASVRVGIFPISLGAQVAHGLSQILPGVNSLAVVQGDLVLSHSVAHFRVAPVPADPGGLVRNKDPDLDGQR